MIDRANGLLLRARGITQDEAYALLRETAMDQGRRLPDVTMALITAARRAVNVVDRPDLCELRTPSIVNRDLVKNAIIVEGAAAALDRPIKAQVAQMLVPNLGGSAALAGRLRSAVAAWLPQTDRRAIWR